MSHFTFPGTLKGIAILCIILFVFAFTQSVKSQFVKGADIGWLDQMEATGYKFYDSTGVEKNCLQILKDKGIYISTELGKIGENIFLALITPILGGKKVLFPLPTIRKEDVLFLKDVHATFLA